MIDDPWTALDEVCQLGDGRAVAVRNVTNTLAFLDTHFPRFAVIPGVLVLGSLGRLATELLAHDEGGAWALQGAARVGFRHFVRPGDRIELVVTLTALDADRATLKGEASVDGRVVVRARVLTVTRVPANASA